MATKMGIPQKKTYTLLYIIALACIVAFPIIVLAGYTLEMTADKNGNIQIFEAVENIGEYMMPENIGNAFKAVVKGSGLTRSAFVLGLFGSLIAVMYRLVGNGKRYHRKGIEHGSARWENRHEKEIIADTTKAGFYNNVICASDVFLVLDRKVREKNEAEEEKNSKKGKQKKNPKQSESKKLDGEAISIKDVVNAKGEAAKIKPMLNLNMIILGGSGTGKSRFFVKPNLLQCNTSFVVTDPSGELVESCGKMLENNGYKIKIFNLNDMRHSSNYNPFHYLKDSTGEINSNNVIKMINVFMTNTKVEGASGGDQFWDDATRLLLSAISFLLIETGDEDEQNFSGVLDLIHKAKLKRMDEKSWEELPGNCDTMIYLGGKDQFTNEYLSKELGKETIDQQSINQTKGRQGSSSYNNAIMGRELATIDELTTMDNNNCIVMVRGLYPFFTEKFNLTYHPRYEELGEGWKPNEQKGETAVDNPYMYYLDRYVEIVPETEFIDFGEFIGEGDNTVSKTLRLRFVTSDDDGEIIEPMEDILRNIPKGIREKFEHCTELYSVA